MSYKYFDDLDGVAKNRYSQKLELLNISECPYRFPAGVWENNPTKWPRLEWGDVYAYLIESPGVYTKESMKNYKSLNAHENFRSGWVQTVLHYQPPGSSHCLLKADVKPSQRVNDPPHQPWVALTKDGTVSAAHCDCMAGLGESCSHIASLLFKIEAAVRLGYTTTACTDEPCKWNQDFVKKVEPDPIAKIKFYKETSVTRSKIKARRRIKPISASTTQEQETLLNALKSCGEKPVVLSCFDGYSEGFHWKKIPRADPQLPPPLRNLYSSETINLSDKDLLAKCDTAMSNLKISDTQQKYLFDITKSQSECLAWYEQRKGRITSSTAHSVLHTDSSNPAKSLIRTICCPSKKEIQVPAILWGRQHEQDALKDYQQAMNSVQPAHTNWSLEKAGLLIDKDLPFIGASADGISKCDCHGSKVVEVKCPYSHRESTLQEFLNDPKCCVENNTLKANHKYYTQVQMQMYVHDVKQCDFVIWSPKFTVVIYVNRDNSFCETMIEKCKTFFRKSILPELLTRQLENSSQNKPAKENKEPVLFCVCRKPEDGNRKMIGCDEPKCDIQWFHFECVKLRKSPKGSWFCKKCRKR